MKSKLHVCVLNVPVSLLVLWKMMLTEILLTLLLSVVDPSSTCHNRYADGGVGALTM